MPTGIVLLADDLSGALDSASPFRLAGHKVAVAINAGSLMAATRLDPDVLAINLDCRALSSDAAAARVRLLEPILAPLKPRLVMLKVDSRLKGPVSALIETAMASTGRRDAVICPAVPDMGRFVVEGHVTGAGIDRPIRVTGCLPAAPAIVCRDASDRDGLEDIAASVLASADTTLAIGARGLAQALAEVTAPEQPVPPSHDPALLPVILAIGSRDPVTIEQVERLCQAAKLGDEELAAQERGSVVLVRPPSSSAGLEPAGVAAKLAENVARIVDHLDGATILASGGDTALAIARRLRLHSLIPQCELLPGVPLSTAPGRPELHIATKSGGFGGPEALIACLAALTGAAAVPA